MNSSKGDDSRSDPLVSIIIPTYNRAHLIEGTIKSVLNQMYTNWELIIVDDGSEDETEKVIRFFNNEKIRYIRIDHCGIFGKVRNQGLKISKGHYVAFLDSDDLWQPEKLENQMHYLQLHPEASFIFTNVEFFGTEPFRQTPEYEKIFVGDVLLPMLEEKRFVFYPSTLLFKKQVVNKIGWIDETLPFTTDLKFFLALCQHFKGIFINERHVKIRKHHQNTTRNVSSDILYENIHILTSLYTDGSLPKKFYELRLSHYYYKMGLSQLHEKQPLKSLVSFYAYIKLMPFDWKGWVRLFQALTYLPIHSTAAKNV